MTKNVLTTLLLAALAVAMPLQAQDDGDARLDIDSNVSFDGLVKVDSDHFRYVWVKPDIDFARYTQVMPGEAVFQFRPVTRS